ncbi:MAG: helix-turn-helix domain-containing protein [Candidatus Korobacteraceae bacterium]
MFTESVYTPEEVAQHLRVPVDAVHREIRSGRLSAMNVAGLLRIRESDLSSYKNEVRAAAIASVPSSPAKEESFLKLQPAADFQHKWPDGSTENYAHTREGVASYSGRTYHVKIGFTVREVAGRPRSRCLVLIDRYPTVEFAGADDKIDDSCMLASVIKDRNGKQLPTGAPAPPEYQGLPIGQYREVVDGPGASNGMAVVCTASDYESLVKHALIRSKYREERV